MGKKRRRRRSLTVPVRLPSDADFRMKTRFQIENVVRESGTFYEKHVHITRSIDEAASARSVNWRRKSQKERYRIIHSALGVQGIFDIFAFYRAQGII